MNLKEKVVIFDIGGVIACDVWEPMFFDSVNGLSKKFSIPSAKAKLVGEKLWRKYSVIAGNPRSIEFDYWGEAIDMLDLPFNVDYYIQWSDEFIRPVVGVGELIEYLLLGGVKLGVCSNHTAFWFEKQYKQINCLKKIGRENMILSFEFGETKDSFPGKMFDAVDSLLRNNSRSEVIYVDDRQHNVDAARSHGYCSYLFKSAPELFLFLRENSYI